MSEPFGAPRRLSTSSVLLWHPDILPAIKVPKEATGWGFKPASDSPGPSDWISHAKNMEGGAGDVWSGRSGEGGGLVF